MRFFVLFLVQISSVLDEDVVAKVRREILQVRRECDLWVPKNEHVPNSQWLFMTFINQLIKIK